MTFALSEMLRNVTLAGIRARHPEYDERRARLALCRQMWGEALFREVHPGVEIAP